MKALTMIATALVLSLTTATADAQKKDPAEAGDQRALLYAIGDVDQNGVVDVQDARQIFVLATGAGAKGLAPLEASDVNQDGRVDISDAAAVLNLLNADEGVKQLRAVRVEKMITLGDADGNGKVTVADIAMVGSYMAGKRQDLELDVAFQAADINGDGSIDSLDLRKLMNHLRSGSKKS